MEIFLRAFAVYLFLLILIRISGQRTLSELTTFDFILVMILSEAAQNALIGEDYSLTRAMTVILILVMLDLGLSVLKKRYRSIETLAEGTPVVLVEQGRLLEEQLQKTYVTRDDILQAARRTQGLERMDQIKYAVLETTGGISIIPQQSDLDRLVERKIRETLLRISSDAPPKA